MKDVAVILAGGKGSRMKSDIPKQYMDLLGKPVIFYALDAFEKSEIDSIILVTGDGMVNGISEEEFCRNNILEKYGITKVAAIVSGGKERYNSVYNALVKISELGGCENVYIHDGARACISQDIIKKCKEDVVRFGSAVAGVPVKDTIKVADSNGFSENTPDRNTLWQIQTPQCFNFKNVYEAYISMINDETKGNITDDAMVMENYSDTKVKLTLSGYENIKITTPEDVAIAEMFLSGK